VACLRSALLYYCGFHLSLDQRIKFWSVSLYGRIAFAILYRLLFLVSLRRIVSVGFAVSVVEFRIATYIGRYSFVSCIHFCEWFGSNHAVWLFGLFLGLIWGTRLELGRRMGSLPHPGCFWVALLVCDTCFGCRSWLVLAAAWSPAIWLVVRFVVVTLGFPRRTHPPYLTTACSLLPSFSLTCIGLEFGRVHWEAK